MSAPSLRVDLPARRPLPVRDDAAASAADHRIAAAFRTHKDRLTSVLVRTGLGTGDAEELAQEAFWVLAQRVSEVPERAERAFLMSTALRLASDRRRSIWHRTLSREWTAEDWAIDAASPEEVCANQDRRLLLDSALELLPEEERDVFILTELEGLSRSETAHVLHLSPGTVASRRTRALARFEGALERLPPVVQRTSRSFGALAAERFLGEQRYSTNPWGQSKAQATFSQRLIERRHHGREQWGWYWHWPGLERSVFAFPEVLIGWKPWAGGETTDGRLPLRLSECRDLSVTYGVETRATGSYNLAVCVWLTATRGGSLLARPETITTELMVWPDYTSGAQPPGRFLRALYIAGAAYELWLARHHGRRFAGDVHGWTVVTLRGVGGQVRGQLPLGEILRELSRLELVGPTDYVSSIELGNEVMGGVGTTFVEQFAISL